MIRRCLTYVTSAWRVADVLPAIILIVFISGGFSSPSAFAEDSSQGAGAVIEAPTMTDVPPEILAAVQRDEDAEETAEEAVEEAKETAEEAGEIVEKAPKRKASRTLTEILSSGDNTKVKAKVDSLRRLALALKALREKRARELEEAQANSENAP